MLQKADDCRQDMELADKRSNTWINLYSRHRMTLRVLYNKYKYKSCKGGGQGAKTFIKTD